MQRTRSRLLLIICSVAWAARASAFGLGELHSTSHLGEHLSAEVDLIVGTNEKIDSLCFRLRAPSGGGDIPWLRHASLGLREGGTRRLSITSDQVMREPVLQIGISVACGFEAQRDYTILLNPLELSSPVLPSSVKAPEPSLRSNRTLGSLAKARFPSSSAQQRRYIAALRNANPELASLGRDDPLPSGVAIPDIAATAAEPPHHPVATQPLVRKERRQEGLATEPEPGSAKAGAAGKPVGGDRLVMLGSIDDPELKVAGDLSSWDGVSPGAPNAEREMLRLEYRMMSLHDEQAAMASAGGATPERIAAINRDLESLRQQVSALSVEVAPPASVAVPKAPPATVAKKPPVAEEGAWSDGWFYGGVLIVVLALAGFFAWQRTRQRRLDRHQLSVLPPEPFVEPGAKGSEAVDFDDDFVEPRHGSAVASVGKNKEAGASSESPSESVPVAPPVEQAVGPLSELLSQRGPNEGATLDEQFAANPVMELAEIMLSFGRVKGAAQALQEYVDHNPSDAVVPWIKLLDIYRIAGMREEFERLAPSLSAHFNIEIQKWDAKPLTDTVIDSSGGGLSLAPLDNDSGEQTRAPTATLENMPHIRERLVRSWGTRDCLDYMHDLLRDNRGGTRAGFPLQVVQELLFLIELLESELKEGEVLLPDIDLS
jgi:pilus assembly protein FimV